MLSLVEHEKSCITSGPGLKVCTCTRLGIFKVQSCVDVSDENSNKVLISWYY